MWRPVCMGVHVSVCVLCTVLFVICDGDSTASLLLQQSKQQQQQFVDSNVVEQDFRINYEAVPSESARDMFEMESPSNRAAPEVADMWNYMVTDHAQEPPPNYLSVCGGSAQQVAVDALRTLDNNSSFHAQDEEERQLLTHHTVIHPVKLTLDPRTSIWTSGMAVNRATSCVFSNVLVDEERIVLAIADPAVKDQLEALADACSNLHSAHTVRRFARRAWNTTNSDSPPQHPATMPTSELRTAFCDCFHSYRIPVFVNPSEFAPSLAQATQYHSHRRASDGTIKTWKSVRGRVWDSIAGSAKDGDEFDGTGVRGTSNVKRNDGHGVKEQHSYSGHVSKSKFEELHKHDKAICTPTIGLETWTSVHHVFHLGIQLSGAASFLLETLHQGLEQQQTVSQHHQIMPFSSLFPKFHHVSFFKLRSLLAYESVLVDSLLQPTFVSNGEQETLHKSFLFLGDSKAPGQAIDNTRTFVQTSTTRFDKGGGEEVDGNDQGPYHPHHFHTFLAYNAVKHAMGISPTLTKVFKQQLCRHFLFSLDESCTASPQENTVSGKRHPTGAAHCPPRAITLLKRQRGQGARYISNMAAISQLLVRLTGTRPRIVSPSESLSVLQQVTMFRDSGLVLSAHSSQVFGMAWMVPRSVVIEVNPVILTTHFGDSATRLNLSYFYALGSTHSVECANNLRKITSDEVEQQEAHQRIKDAARQVTACGGTYQCTINAENELKNSCGDSADRSACVQRLHTAARDATVCSEFDADLQVLELVVKQAVKGLNQVCMQAEGVPWATV
eukprot:m.85832 g.85832  ORF g.85832 m.85832 type:complete len:783 (-) comp12789_c0_seq3:73-2421(-)